MGPDLARYSCQLALPGFGTAAQELLQRSRVLIVGLGGLGCPAATYLAAAGIGTLGIADHDTISISNLHRQVLYNEAEVGQKKVAVAHRRLQQQNPNIQVVAHDEKITADNVQQLVAAYDLIVDATDNFETHYLLNDACVIAGKPLVHGAIYQYEGHVAVWNMPNGYGTRSPNYRDVFPEVNALQIPDCADGGVMPSIAGMIGCMQANEAIKVITNTGDPLKGGMLIFDALTMQSRIINIGHSTQTNITELDSYATVYVISMDELKEQLGSDNFFLVDVRTLEEHTIYNIGGLNIPLAALEDSIAKFGDKEQIVFYCASGKRSMQAAKWLKEKLPGVNVASLEGGIKDW